jgi:hypothetical protein
MITRAHAWLYAALLLASCGSPVVGAECRAGWLECDGICVEVQTDEHNCGACGHECGPFECSGGMCGPLRAHEDAGTDASMSVPDAGLDAGTEPGIGKGGIGSPFLPDSGLSGCALGETECASDCVDTLTDRYHCGDCDTQCKGAEVYCIAGVCKDVCEDPLHLCNSACVDYQTDERNCGSCGHVCTSGICTDGKCSDVIPGSLIVIGHNFSAATPAMQVIASNAVLLPQGASVRVLVYRGSASRAEYNGVINAINANGKQWQQVNVTVDRVVPELATAETLVILPQDTTSDSALDTIGRSWALAISQFLYRGGVVVLFEGVSTKNHGTYHLLDAAGVFAASGRESIPVQTLTVNTPGFDIAANASTTYRSAGGTVHFLDVSSDGTVVVEDKAGDPVVIHRVISP